MSLTTGLDSKDEGLIEDDIEDTAYGTTKVKYVQTLDGIPVYGTSLVLEKNRTADGDRFTSFSEGGVYHNLASDLPNRTPNISKSEAFAIAIKESGYNSADAQFNMTEDIKLEIYEKDMKAHLAYILSFNVETTNITAYPNYVVDAVKGEVIDHWEGLCE